MSTIPEESVFPLMTFAGMSTLYTQLKEVAYCLGIVCQFNSLSRPLSQYCLQLYYRNNCKDKKMMYVKYCFNPSIKSSIMALCNVPVLTYPILCRTSRDLKRNLVLGVYLWIRTWSTPTVVCQILSRKDNTNLRIHVYQQLKLEKILNVQNYLLDYKICLRRCSVVTFFHIPINHTAWKKHHLGLFFYAIMTLPFYYFRYRQCYKECQFVTTATTWNQNGHQVTYNCFKLSAQELPRLTAIFIYF